MHQLLILQYLYLFKVMGMNWTDGEEEAKEKMDGLCNAMIC